MSFVDQIRHKSTIEIKVIPNDVWLLEITFCFDLEEIFFKMPNEPTFCIKSVLMYTNIMVIYLRLDASFTFLIKKKF